MVSAIEEEALEAMERLRQCCESDMLVDQNFNIPIFNILWRMATNQRYSVSGSMEETSFISKGFINVVIQLDDPFINNLAKDLQLNFENAIKYNLFLPIKRLAAFLGFCNFEHVERFYSTLKELFRKVIYEHEKEFDSGTIPKVC